MTLTASSARIAADRLPTVLHIIDSDGPGGSESILASLAERSDELGVRSAAVVPGAGDWLTTQLRRLDVPVEHVSTSWPSGRSFDHPYLLGLRRALISVRPDLIHAHSHGVGFYVALAQMIAFNTAPLAVTFHGTTDLAQNRRFQWLKWRLLRRASAIACVSRGLSLAARGTEGVLADRVRCIYNGIDVDRFVPAAHRRLREQYGVTDDTILLGALGNVRPAKGYDVLLHAVAHCRGRGARVRLLIAGDDKNELADELRMLARRLALTDAVSFVGFVAETAEFLNGLDVLVVSSHTEGFSLAAAQAQSCGLPVVSTRCGGPEEILIHSETGLLVETANAAALGDAILQLVRDPALRHGLAAKARANAVLRFSLASMRTAYATMYSELMGRAHQHAPEGG